MSTRQTIFACTGAAIALVAIALAAAEAKGPPAAVMALAGTYAVARDGAETGCTLALKPTALGQAERRVVRAVEFAEPCRDVAPALLAATGWAWTGGGSVTLYGGRTLREKAHFSPVQDGTGVYLRGAAAGSANLLELRRGER
jgi:hypothetical protein